MPQMHERRPESYQVGWISALPVEIAAASEMLDEEHGDLPQSCTDDNIYTPGRMGEHNVVIAHLPSGRMGTNSAAAVATEMKARFRCLRFVLLVGIGGGVPSDAADIRLGDVVVSLPTASHGGVVHHDNGKQVAGQFQRSGALNQPPRLLLTALAKVQARHLRGRGSLSRLLAPLAAHPYFDRRRAGPDQLFMSTYDHVGGGTACMACDPGQTVQRAPRADDASVVTHYGTIASGNQVMKDGAARDRISAELGGVLCYEMEAAGLMNEFPCLVIRGICDYADSHKTKAWQPFAAAAAAAQAKEILSVIPGHPADQINQPKPTKEDPYREASAYVIFDGANHAGLQMGVNNGIINAGSHRGYGYAI